LINKALIVNKNGN